LFTYNLTVQLATLESLSVYWNTNSKSLAGKEDAMAAFSELVSQELCVGGGIPLISL
jgi:hypothetical protein